MEQVFEPPTASGCSLGWCRDRRSVHCALSSGRQFITPQLAFTAPAAAPVEPLMVALNTPVVKFLKQQWLHQSRLNIMVYQQHTKDNVN